MFLNNIKDLLPTKEANHTIDLATITIRYNSYSQGTIAKAMSFFSQQIEFENQLNNLLSK